MLFSLTVKAVLWLYEMVLVLLDWITDEKYDFVLRYITAKRGRAKEAAASAPMTAAQAAAAGRRNVANRRAYSAPAVLCRLRSAHGCSFLQSFGVRATDR